MYVQTQPKRAKLKNVNLLIGAPGSGKTRALVERVRSATQSGKLVWWVGLPGQRNYVYRRLTEDGALLGVEFLSSQQVYYRLLAHALKLKPLVVGTGRLALVGEALKELRNELPAPGEARLFATAIAEAKRYGLTPDSVTVRDEESLRFKEVFARYERVKGEAWDYDDFRTEAHAYALTMRDKPEADLIVVDGLREVGPLELRIYKALAKHVDVTVALPEAPPGETASETLAPRAPNNQTVYRAANPVSEARWVLRALKKELAAGADPLDLAVILPEREVRAFMSLADEYGVPMMDETPKALADTLAGRLLMDLLELPDYPTASRLLAIPELSTLANAALNLGVAGLEAINVLARETGTDASWHKWLGLLDVPEGELAWAESLLEVSLPNLRADLLTDEGLGWEQFKKHALQRAKEASTLAKGASFRAWWSALLQETKVFNSPRGGVALLTDKLASGRRFKRAFLMHAAEGAYRVGEVEDYFVPEEARKSLRDVFDTLQLPKKFLGRDAGLYAELLTRADSLTVTYPEATQGGPLVPEIELVGKQKSAPLPPLAAASRLELASDTSFKAGVSALPLGRAGLERLRRYDDCAFQYWAESSLPQEPGDWWQELLAAMRDHKRLNAARLDVLKGEYPQAAGWLADYAHVFTTLNFGETLPQVGDGLSAYLDAAGRSGNEVSLYRFAKPGLVGNQAEAGKYIDRRWNEHWAAAHMLERYQGRVSRVNIVVWCVNGAPLDAYDGGIRYVWRRIANKQKKIAKAYAKFQTGEVSPSPGFRCRECKVSDMCREGQR